MMNIKTTVLSYGNFFKNLISYNQLIDTHSLIIFVDEIDYLDSYKNKIALNYIIVDQYDIKPHQIEQSKYNSSFKKADELALFIKKEANKGKSFIVVCEYGVSRSAGCAAAIEEYYNQNGNKYFVNKKYDPNKIIFDNLLSKLIKIEGI